MGLIAKIKRHKTPKSLAKAVYRKLSGQNKRSKKAQSKVNRTPVVKNGENQKPQSASNSELYRILEIENMNRPNSTKDNHCTLEVFNLSRVSAFRGHASFAHPSIADRFEKLMAHVGRALPTFIFASGRGNELHVGLHIDDLQNFSHICEAWFQTKIKWSGKGIKAVHASQNDFAKQVSKSDQISTEIFFGSSISANLVVTFYKSDVDKVTSPNSKNEDFRFIRGDLSRYLAQPGVHYLSDVMGAPTSQAVNFPVDVVYTWVNDEDPDWQEIYFEAKEARQAELAALESDTAEDDEAISINALEGAEQSNDGDMDHDVSFASSEESDTDQSVHQGDTDALSRFKNREELKYSLRSIEQYMPWVRKIFVFSNCAMPKWLTETDNLVWVRHEDVMDSKHLPTFNSHAIESYLHKIPDLSEHFIYFNDDFFVNQAIPVNLFFMPNGMCQSNLEDYGVVNGRQVDTDPDYLNAARNCVELIKRDFGMVPTRLHKHSPYAMSKSVCDAMESRYSDEYEQTRLGQFRSSTDISTASFLFHHFGYATRAVNYSGFRSKLVKNTARNLEADFKMLNEQSTVRTFCLNDGNDSHEDERWNDMICDFLAQRFPLPTRAELGLATAKEQAEILGLESAEPTR